MADEITITDIINVTKGRLVNRGLSVAGIPITFNGSQYVGQVQTIGTSPEALVMGDVTVPGRYVMANNEASGGNSIQIGSNDSTGFHPLDELDPGESSSGRLAINTPFAKAIGGSAELEYFILED